MTIWLLRGTLFLVSLFWILVLLGSQKAKKEARWVLTPDGDGPAEPVTISVVVPARNEAENIRACVEALLAQDHPIEIVVIDDGSTDGTSAILAEFNDQIRVIDGGGGALPEGWLGKPWACHRASKECSGEVLLFIDADVRLHPRAVSVAAAIVEERELGLLSLLGHQEMRTFWERVLQPAVGGLILAGNDLNRQNDPETRSDRPLANGQFMMFSRSAYEAIGGHQAVQGNVLDDVGLAVAVENQDLPFQLLFARQLLTVRMYDSLASIWQGWTKNLFAGLKESWLNLALTVGFVFVTNVLPYVVLVVGAFVGGEALWWGLGSVVIIQGVRITLDRIFEQDPRYSAFHVLGATMLLMLLVHSAIKSVSGTRSWKGRTV